MDKYRKELIELIVAIETNDPRLIKTINRIKAGFNSHTDFQYRELLRRAEDAQDKREAPE